MQLQIIPSKKQIELILFLHFLFSNVNNRWLYPQRVPLKTMADERPDCSNAISTSWNVLLQVPRCTVCCKKESQLGTRLSSFPLPPGTFKRAVEQDPFVRVDVCGNTEQVSASRSSTVCRWDSFVVTTMTSQTGKKDIHRTSNVLRA